MLKLKHKSNHRAKYDLYDDIEKIKAAFRDTTLDIKGRAGEVLTDSFESIKEQTTNTKDAVENYTAKKPFKSLGIALVAGLAIGYLLKK
jgi:ElaB/YqjD/DUF883 family membrane-anchored ribosome-binding protein